MVERKGLKDGFKVTHEVKSIIYINQTKLFQMSVKNGFLEMSLLPMCRGLPRFVGKPSVVLRRLISKWLSKEHLRCLVEAIKRIDVGSLVGLEGAE